MAASAISDIDAFVRQLISRDLSRAKFIQELSRKQAQFERAGKAKQRQKGRRPDRGENEFAQMQRVGRLLYFLHHGTPAFGFTAADNALADEILEHLSSRGEW